MDYFLISKKDIQCFAISIQPGQYSVLLQKNTLLNVLRADRAHCGLDPDFGSLVRVSKPLS